MTYNVKLRLVTPMLGDLFPSGRDGVRHFRKKGNCLLVDREAWMETFTRAVLQLGMSVDVTTILPPEFILMASTHLFRKEFSRVKVELFESFRKGTILCIQVEAKDTKRAPNLEQMQAVLTYIGEHLGLSPWGSKFGFGRFTVLEISK